MLWKYYTGSLIHEKHDITSQAEQLLLPDEGLIIVSCFSSPCLLLYKYSPQHFLLKLIYVPPSG